MESVSRILLIKRERGNGFTFQLNFQVNSLDTGFFQSLHDGEFTAVELSNVDSYTITKNGGSVTVPFSVVRNDIISVTIVRTDTALASSIKLTSLTHDQDDEARTIFSTDTGTGRYIYCLNHRDQTVSVIDTDTDTVTATITLPASNDWLAMCYRIVNQSVYLFGKNSTNTPCCRIDADPASGTFNNVYSLSGVLNGTTNVLSGLGFGTIISAVYDYTNDIIFYSDGSNGALLNPVSVAGGSLNSISALSSFSLIFNESNGTLVSPEGAAAYQYLYAATNSMTKRTFRKAPSAFATTALFNKKNGITYGCGNGMTLLNNDLNIIASLSTGSNWGDMAFGTDYDLIMLAHTFDGKNWIIDSVGNTIIGSWTRGDLGASETHARGCVYSPYSKKFYVQASGTTGADGINRVHVYNPQLWIDDGENPANLSIMDEGHIIVGDLYSTTGSGTNRYDQMCANSLL